MEQTGTVVESARHNRWWSKNTEFLGGIGLTRQGANRNNPAVPTTPASNDMAARLRAEGKNGKKRVSLNLEETGQPELAPFRSMKKGTEQTGTVVESARHNRRRSNNAEFPGGIGPTRQGRDRNNLAVATTPASNDMAARLRAEEHVVKPDLACTQKAPAARSAAHSRKARKRDGADWRVFGTSNRFEFKPTQLPPVPTPPAHRKTRLRLLPDPRARGNLAPSQCSPTRRAKIARPGRGADR